MLYLLKRPAYHIADADGITLGKKHVVHLLLDSGKDLDRLFKNMGISHILSVTPVPYHSEIHSIGIPGIQIEAHLLYTRYRILHLLIHHSLLLLVATPICCVKYIMQQADRHIPVILLQQGKEFVRNLCNGRVRALDKNNKIGTRCYRTIKRAVEIGLRSVETRHIYQIHTAGQQLASRSLYGGHESSVRIYVRHIQGHMFVDISWSQRPVLTAYLRNGILWNKAAQMVHDCIHLLHDPCTVL